MECRWGVEVKAFISESQHRFLKAQAKQEGMQLGEVVRIIIENAVRDARDAGERFGLNPFSGGYDDD